MGKKGWIEQRKRVGLAAVVFAKADPPSQARSAFTAQLGLVPAKQLVQVHVDQ